jgi:hypothetical protein
MTPTKYEATVLFSTHNGEKVLQKTLDGYLKQAIDNKAWQLIIIDNASNDSTPAILESFEKKLPLVLLKHNILGKNKALNAAIDYIKSDFVIITDDDAIPEKHFLLNWIKIKNEKKDYDLFGGNITPLFSKNNLPPSWMHENKFHWEEIHAVRDLTSKPIEAKEIFGPNMAVRKSIFDKGILFNEDIGPNGSNENYPMGSETEFCKRAELNGHKAFFNSESKVMHIIRDHQVKPEFWFSRAYKHGLGFGMQEKLESNAPYSLIKKILITLKGVYKTVKHKTNSLLYFSNQLKRNQEIWQYNWEKGYLIGILK